MFSRQSPIVVYTAISILSDVNYLVEIRPRIVCQMFLSFCTPICLCVKETIEF